MGVLTSTQSKSNAGAWARSLRASFVRTLPLPLSQLFVLPHRSTLCFLLLAVCFLIINDQRTSFYQNFSALHWEEVEGYTQGASTELPRAYVSTSSSSPQRSLTSKAFAFSYPGLIIEYSASGTSECSLQVSFLDTSQHVLQRISLPTTTATPGMHTWRKAKVVLPFTPSAAPQATLRFAQQGTSGCQSAIRSRVEWISFSPLLSVQRFFRNSLFASLLICSAFAAATVWFLLVFFAQAPHNLRVFSALLTLTLATQLRLASYYYWDEWHALERFAQEGVASAFLTHNEHFLPLFFLLYPLEAKVFSGYYLPLLLVSCLLHSLIAYCCFLLFQRFGAQRFAAGILAAIFAMHSLHSETLQWAFEQSLLLCHLAMVLSILLGIRFLEKGSTRAAIISCSLAVVAPMCFGNGFILAAYWPLLALAYLINAPTYRLKTVLLRGVALTMLLLLSLCIPVALYLVFREGHGHTIAQAKLFENLKEVLAYLFVGSQLGTFLRGIGAVPSLELGVAPHVIAALQQNLPFLPIPAVRAELLLASLAFGCSVVLLLLSQVLTRRAFTLWCLGQLMMGSSLLLPALGRWSFGLSQSLSLRYHYGSLIGLLLLLLPLVQWAFEGQRGASTRARGTAIVLWLFLSVQLWTAMQFSYFQEAGRTNRLFTSALLDWRSTIGEELPYSGQGSRFEGLQPSLPAQLTPGRHPNEIYAVLRWLEGDKRPSELTQVQKDE